MRAVRLRAQSSLGLRVLPDVERVKIVAQRHEHAAMIRLFLGDAEAERVAVETLRRFDIRDRQQHMPDAFQLHHGASPVLSAGSAAARSRSSLAAADSTTVPLK